MISLNKNKPCALKIKKNDNVGTVINDTAKSEPVNVLFDDKFVSIIFSREPIPMAHKIALQDIALGDKILKYGECIGQATSDISVGCHVHVHNIKSLRGRSDID